MRGMKGSKLLEARSKAEERQKVKSFMPNDTTTKVEAEGAKVCDILLLLSNIMRSYAFLRPNPPNPRPLQLLNQHQRRMWKLP